MKTTIKMVAEYAGVSRGTVDRVLHDRGNVNPAVLMKVRDALSELEYTPNAIARALVSNRSTRKLGFLLPSQPGYFRDEVMRGIQKIEEECEDLGIEVCVRECNVMEPGTFVQAIDEMLAEGVCGIAICAQNSVHLVEKINQVSAKGIPFITVNSDIPDSDRKCFIGEDAVKSGQVAAEIVLKYLKNQEEILIIGGNPEFTAHQNRVRGFRDYMEHRGIAKERCRVIYTYENYELTCAKVREMLTEHPGIGSVYMAVKCVSGYVNALQKVDLPYHLFAVSHDTDEETLSLLQKGLIDFTIDQDLFSQGYRPLQMLIDHFLYRKTIENANDKIIYHIVSAECVG